MNAHVDRWNVEIYLSDRDGTSHAEARLMSGRTPPLHAAGAARLHEHDPLDVPEIGYELAAGRALHELADLLLETADDDVAAVTSEHWS